MASSASGGSDAGAVLPVARLLEPTEENLEEAGAALRAGRCVAFPTETVYGLGANALDAVAVANVFKYKGRPASDPLIVHVLSVEDALSVIDVDDVALGLFRLFAARFWPGPLTVVCKAKPCIPPSVTAGTGYVGTRSPSHPIARALLATASVPVAAPSANRFCHVSPTTAAHVMADLGSHPILIVDGEVGAAASSAGHTSAGAPSAADSSCSVGIESTVVKIDTLGGLRRCVLFRRGGVPETDLRAVAAEAGFLDFVVVGKAAPMPAGPLTATPVGHVGDEEDFAPSEAPGQLTTHYAPDGLHTLLVTSVVGGGVSQGSGSEPLPIVAAEALARTVVIDYGGHLASLKPRVARYMDLSPSADDEEACRNLFSMLRETEGVRGAEVLLLCDPLLGGQATGGLVDGLRDRMFRSASGRAVVLHEGESPYVAGQ